jgi:Helix-turn-helix domain
MSDDHGEVLMEVGSERSLPPLPTAHALGDPMTIEEVAGLLGCSPWTVRQRYLRQGLPHLQARPRGKLVFFREQVIAWTLKRQRQKGGITR